LLRCERHRNWRKDKEESLFLHGHLAARWTNHAGKKYLRYADGAIS